MPSLLDALCRRFIRRGALTVSIGLDGPPRTYGDGAGPAVAIRLRDGATARSLALDPSLVLGEAYADGRLTIEKGDLYDLLSTVMSNQMAVEAPASMRAIDRVRRAIRPLTQRNDPRRAARNIAHHYDLPDAFYDLFLDTERQYSCAYFTPGDDLAAAQRRKMRHLTAKLGLKPEHKVLDIGSGWGGLAHYMAQMTGAHVTGITLSRRQLDAAARHYGNGRVADRLHFALSDWRSVTGRFDRIVSVGMLEHVGIGSYADYFQKIRRLMADEGVAVIHTIGRSDGPGFTNPFIQRHIFPGGYFPALSELMPAIEASGVLLTDVEVLRLHYAETLAAWRQRFRARWAEAVRIAGAPFCRTWEFYLASSEAAFRYQLLVVFQLQVAKRIETVPLTRDYIIAAEASLAALERAAEGTRDDRRAS
jgi:cyclopropane-fatty-acyl-phospholipid synthase